jgi:hypothetical protein
MKVREWRKRMRDIERHREIMRARTVSEENEIVPLVHKKKNEKKNTTRTSKINYFFI